MQKPEGLQIPDILLDSVSVIQGVLQKIKDLLHAHCITVNAKTLDFTFSYEQKYYTTRLPKDCSRQPRFCFVKFYSIE